MSIPIEARAQARRNAPFHVQLQLTRVPAACPNRKVEIEGRVVRTFRGEAHLRPGALVSFSLWVVRRGGEPTGPAFVYHDALVEASHMEVYLEGTPPQCRVAAYEFTLLHTPTAVPRMSDDDLERLEAMHRSGARFRRARWWEIWKH